jgi:hypothetical protein
MRRTWWVAASVVGLILLCGTVRADQINYKADLGGASEVPPVPGGATGDLFGSQRSRHGRPHPRSG